MEVLHRNSYTLTLAPSFFLVALSSLSARHAIHDRVKERGGDLAQLSGPRQCPARVCRDSGASVQDWSSLIRLTNPTPSTWPGICDSAGTV